MQLVWSCMLVICIMVGGGYSIGRTGLHDMEEDPQMKCECVQNHLCKDAKTINVDGDGLIDLRTLPTDNYMFNNTECKVANQMCCCHDPEDVMVSTPAPAPGQQDSTVTCFPKFDTGTTEASTNSSSHRTTCYISTIVINVVVVVSTAIGLTL